MNYSHKSQKILVTGSSGTGKTLLAHSILTAGNRLKFVFDHQGEFAHRFKLPLATSMRDMVTHTNSGLCIYDPAREWPGQLPEAFNYFCDFVFTVSSRLKGKKILMVDEIQRLIGTTDVPPEFLTIVETGRRQSLDLLLVAQAPNLIHNRIRNQLTEVYAFRTIDKRALEFLEGCGISDGPGLKPGQWVYRNLNTGKMTSGKVF